MTTVRRTYADVAGRQVHYRCAGAPEAPTLVLFHQSPSTSAMYEAMMASLGAEFYVLAPDSPGFGGSDALEGRDDIVAYARHLGAWLDVLGVSRCALFGHHTGAAVATELAAQRPELCMALALSGPTLLTEDQREALPGSVAGIAADEAGSHLQELWQRLRAKDPRVPLGLSQREMLSALACGEHYRGSYQAVCDHDYEAALAKLQCPVLAFAGEEDALLGAVAPTLALVANGQTRPPIAAARTYVCESDAAEVADTLAAFVRAANNKE